MMAMILCRVGEYRFGLARRARIGDNALAEISRG